MRININDLDKGTIGWLSKGGTLQKRACVIFQILLLNKNFKNFVSRMRVRLQIPKDGYDIRKDEDLSIVMKRFTIQGQTLRDMVTKRRLQADQDIEQEIEKFLKEEGLVKFYSEMGLFGEDFISSIIVEYTILGYIKLIGVDVGLLMKTEYDTDDMEDEVEIRFMASATKEEMIDFIKKNWEEIKILKEKILGKEKLNKRKKIAGDFLRDVEIYNKYQEVLVVPSKKRGSKYIDLKLSRNYRIDGKKMNEGTIRSIVGRMSRLVKEANRR